MKIATKIYKKTFDVIKKLLGLLEIFLAIRLVLKMLAANPLAPVVNLVYKGSDFLVAPFKYIFTDFYWKGLFVDTATISAMIGYCIIVFLLFRILRLFSD
jgi:hypothetical protein